MIKSRKVSNHVTITLTKDEMVYLQRLANLDNVGLGVKKASLSSTCSAIVKRFIWKGGE